jgi:hypothetical protein
MSNEELLQMVHDLTGELIEARNEAKRAATTVADLSRNIRDINRVCDGLGISQCHVVNRVEVLAKMVGQ